MMAMWEMNYTWCLSVHFCSPRGLRVQYANLFSNNIQTMRQFFSQEDFGGIFSFVLSCLTLLDV